MMNSPQNKNVYLFHMLNDFSGSPLILSHTVEALKASCNLHVVTSKTTGFLGDKDAVIGNGYVWSENPLVLYLSFFWSQWLMFLLVIKNRKRIDLIYINTLLPFGAAIASKLCGLSIIYHLHEPQFGNKWLFKWCQFVMSKSASKVIYVSNYLKTCFPETDHSAVVFNSLSNEFLAKVSITPMQQRETVLMLCSFKAYKGYNEFVGLAKAMPNRKFRLILNASELAIKSLREQCKALSNLEVLPAQTNVHQHYRTAKIVLNLSDRNAWVESFGMTALEAMAYGIPCIVPQVGGISEVVNDDELRIDSHDHNGLKNKIEQLFDDNEYYQLKSDLLLQRLKDFEYSSYERQILSICT